MGNDVVPAASGDTGPTAGDRGEDMGENPGLPGKTPESDGTVSDGA